MKALKIIFYLQFAFVISAIAQTYQQKGVVRMITTSASSPITPVAGVKVTVGNSVSKPTNKNGQFAMQVTKQFQVNDVSGGNYIIAMPAKGKIYTQSPNDMYVIVTTKSKKDEDYKRLYTTIQQKYNKQAKEVIDMKRRCKSVLDVMDSSDKRYAITKNQLDSLYNLYLESLLSR